MSVPIFAMNPEDAAWYGALRGASPALVSRSTGSIGGEADVARLVLSKFACGYDMDQVINSFIGTGIHPGFLELLFPNPTDTAMATRIHRTRFDVYDDDSVGVGSFACDEEEPAYKDIRGGPWRPIEAWLIDRLRRMREQHESEKGTKEPFFVRVQSISEMLNMHSVLFERAQEYERWRRAFEMAVAARVLYRNAYGSGPNSWLFKAGAVEIPPDSLLHLHSAPSVVFYETSDAIVSAGRRVRLGPAASGRP